MEKSNNSQVRGTELKEKMKKSEEEGKQFRAEHQGADITSESKPMGGASTNTAESKNKSTRKTGIN